MERLCAFCGKPFDFYDGYARKYCSECQKSGKRFYEQFRERCKKDPVADIYAKNYSKLHALYKKNIITKQALDDWRYRVKVKKQEISAGEITVEDFSRWCAETYDSMKSSDNLRTELILPLTIAPYMFIGRKPAAVIFADERVAVKSWREVFTVILSRCNQDPIHHKTLMALRGRLAGPQRVFLSEHPDSMTSPVKIDEDMYAETHYGAATLIHILLKRILDPVRYDYFSIKIAIKQ